MNQNFTYSFAVLAGGKSRRMGHDKAAILWKGKTFLQHQLDKAFELGCTDIMVCGGDYTSDGVRKVADSYPNRGPLGGIHSCLTHAREDACMILSVDVPQISAVVLRQLAALYEKNQADAVLLRTAHGIEPLIGLYGTHLAERIAPMLEKGSPGVYELLREIKVQELLFDGADNLINCNTEKDVLRLLSLGDAD